MPRFLSSLFCLSLSLLPTTAQANNVSYDHVHRYMSMSLEELVNVPIGISSNVDNGGGFLSFALLPLLLAPAGDAVFRWGQRGE